MITKKGRKPEYGDDISMREYDAGTTEKRTRIARGGVRYRRKTAVTQKAAKEGSLIQKLRLIGYPTAWDADEAVRAATAAAGELCALLERMTEKEAEILGRRDAERK